MAENKVSIVHFRCTASERKQIERMAEPFGSLSNFLLTVILTDKKVIIDPKTFLKGMDELTVAINRVGNNVNQIAKYANAYKEINPVLMQEWLEILSEYNSILNTVEKKLDNIFKHKQLS